MSLIKIRESSERKNNKIPLKSRVKLYVNYMDEQKTIIFFSKKKKKIKNFFICGVDFHPTYLLK